MNHRRFTKKGRVNRKRFKNCPAEDEPAFALVRNFTDRKKQWRLKPYRINVLCGFFQKKATERTGMARGLLYVKSITKDWVKKVLGT